MLLLFPQGFRSFELVHLGGKKSGGVRIRSVGFAAWAEACEDARLVKTDLWVISLAEGWDHS